MKRALILIPVVTANVFVWGQEHVQLQAGEATSQKSYREMVAERQLTQEKHKATGGKSGTLIDFAELAKNGKDADTRIIAVGKLNDQTLLADIARSDTNARVRQSAAERLTDQLLSCCSTRMKQ